MDRPRSITVLAYIFLGFGALSLLLAIPAFRLSQSYTLFGATVSSRTYATWILSCGCTWFFYSYAFFQGLTLGMQIYLGLKAAHWGVTLLSGNLSLLLVPAALVDFLILGLIWKEKEWFRN